MGGKRLFGKVNGSDVYLHTLKSGRLEAEILDYGAIVRKLCVDGRNIVFGFDDIEGYIKTDDYHGAIVGRCANRIAGGRFTLGGRTYTLERNEGGVNHLHGGRQGFDKTIWDCFGSDKYISMSKTFLDGEQGYPGKVEVTITYLIQYNRFYCVIDAECDADTVFNPTLHCYFNLAGTNGNEDILGHQLTLYADRYNRINEQKIPIGDAVGVEGTPFDFRKPKPIGERIDSDDEQLKKGNGYDHNFIINKDNSSAIKISGKTCYRAATVEYDDLTMDLFTSQPCIQFYSGNSMNKAYPFTGRVEQRPRLGFCLEPQFVPNSPNLPDCGESLLKESAHFKYIEVLEFR